MQEILEPTLLSVLRRVAVLSNWAHDIHAKVLGPNTKLSSESRVSLPDAVLGS